MSSEKRLDFNKYDKYGQLLTPGDICIRQTKDGPYRRNIEFVLYKGVGKGSVTGEYGRFITTEGESSIKHSSVIFAFDPLSERRARTDEIKKITSKYYTGEKNV